MGRRMLEVDGRLLIELLKSQAGAGRRFTVDDGLPDDVQIVTTSLGRFNTVKFTLASEQWEGDSYELLTPPTVSVTYLDPPEPTKPPARAGKGAKTK